MALVPKFELEIKNTCDKVDVWEMTNAYSGGNLTGWGTPNIDTSVVTAANIKIYDYTGTTLLQTIVLYDGVIDVYSTATGAPTPSTFKAFTDASWTQPDGIYKAIYTVGIGEVTYVSVDQWCLFTCNLCNCMESLLLKMSELCAGDKLDKYKEVYDRLEVLKYAVEAAHVSCDFATATALLAEANTLCTTFSDCGCGCNDCN
jgi:hypothetical protein